MRPAPPLATLDPWALGLGEFVFELEAVAPLFAPPARALPCDKAGPAAAAIINPLAANAAIKRSLISSLPAT